MFEKVNPSHPDKVTDRIAGAILDLAKLKNENFISAIECTIGHGKCLTINETNTHIENEEIKKIVNRLAPEIKDIEYIEVKQDEHLAKNQSEDVRCGDNGICKGVPITEEQKTLTSIAKEIYKHFPTDGKYIINEEDKTLIICQSCAKEEDIRNVLKQYEKNYKIIINPLGEWTGNSNVDTGCVNRKLGSDMGDAVTGGGLSGKDTSKADVSLNIYCHILAQHLGREVSAYCAIGDTKVKINGEYIDYKDIVKVARKYINELGGFEEFAEWGLIR